MSGTTRVLLLRHGQSTWNADGRWQGQADPPLSSLGRLQANAAVAALGAVDAIVASDLVRAVETAHLLAVGIGVGPVIVDPRWRERDAGEWTGLTRAEIDAGWPNFLNDGRRPLGWEPAEIVAARAIEALTALAVDFAGAEVVAVTHSGVIRSVETAMGIDEGARSNLAGRWVDVRSGGLTLGDWVKLVDHAALAASMVE